MREKAFKEGEERAQQADIIGAPVRHAVQRVNLIPANGSYNKTDQQEESACSNIS
jgi:hypothetical protein